MSGSELLDVDIRFCGAELRVAVRGELDFGTEETLVGLATGAMSSPSACSAVVDLTGVSFIDSSGLRAVLRCRDVARARGLDFCLAVSEGPVSRLLEVAGVKAWFRYE